MKNMEVDVRAELEQYEWTGARWSHDRLIAASPFRYETRPSFFVTLDPDSAYYGCWGDSGAVDDEWQSGNFTKLLSFLRAETYEETEEYLRYMYGAPAEVSTLELRVPTLEMPKQVRRSIDSSILDGFTTADGTHVYLTGRGIDPRVQRLCKIGYDRGRSAVTMPWYNPDGTLGNVMYRSTRGKAFWYHRGGRKIAEMVYGLNIIYDRRIKRAAIVEAPIDAMSIMSAGVMAVATGGTAFGRRKAELIRKSPLEEIVIVRDNDGPGRAWQRKIVEALRGDISVKIATIPRQYKDSNDLVTDGKKDVILRRINELSKSVDYIKPICT